LDETVDRGDAESEFVKVGRLEPMFLEVAEKLRFTSAPLDQRPAGALRIELEAQEETTVLDIAELDFESNSGIEKSRPIRAGGVEGFDIDQTHQGRELDVAAKDRGAADDRKHLLHGLPLGLGRDTEVTDYHEDEADNRRAHPGILVHCVGNTYSTSRTQYTTGVCAEPGTLWIVATPIGTLGDASPRVTEVLSEVSVILAEDTRRAGRLLSHLEVPGQGRLQSFHEHNEKKKVPPLLAKLREGSSIALISDAGTPVLSDPGYVLVRSAREAGLRVCSVPGASAFTAALAAAGQPPLPATLCGFLPPRAGPRRRRIAELDAAPWTIVILLSPHRLARELADVAEVLGGERRATLLAELSKRYERAESGTLSALAGGREAQSPRGEYVLVVAPRDECRDTEVDPEVVSAEYRRALAEGMDRSDALRAAARRLGIRKRQVFDILAKDSESDDG
jgi:16S rRNA (cytidine1402-2'-O)-methyltransferase